MGSCLGAARCLGYTTPIMNRLFTPPPASPGPSADSAAGGEVMGVLERIKFHNPDNGYTVGKLKTERLGEEVTVIGTFSNPVVGQYLRCEGVWINHPQWGRQMQVRKHEAIVPATADAIEKYLGSGMVKGIGPVTAARIVAQFGDDSLDIIEHHPQKLLAVKGIGEKLLNRIVGAWHEQRAIRNIMVFLQSHGVTPAIAVKIYKHYRERSIEIVERNPYQLATDIWGVGFRSADKIAQNLGFALDDPRRLIAGVVYTLNSAVESGGNVYLTAPELRDAAEQILGTREIDDALVGLVVAEKLIREVHPSQDAIGLGPAHPEDPPRLEDSPPLPEPFRPEDGTPPLKREDGTGANAGDRDNTHVILPKPVEPEEAYYIPALYFAEVGAAKALRRRSQEAGRLLPALERDADWLAKCLDRHGLDLSIEQHGAVDLAIRSQVMVLTGGPGTGKTTTTRAIVHAFTDLHQRVLLASPTGRAAKRLTEVTGFDATTIHRLLAFDPANGGFKYGQDAPLDCDVLILDEVSMLDIVLANAVLRALRPETKVIFIGDVDQLPSVGPGNFLRDLIDSKTVPVGRLTQVFRQAAASRIVTNAHRVNRGHMPELLSPKVDDTDFVFIGANEAEELADKIVAIVARSLPRRGHSIGDIQVLVPMQKGVAGAIALNHRLQEALNPPHPTKPEIAHANRLFRVGDRVIQLRNNYDRGVYNGDVGTVIAISHEDSTITVRMGESEVSYDFGECDEMALAYALTIHKSQGSEFPVAVIAVHTQHYMLLPQRNLLYTAITRAKRYAVIVGSPRAIGICIKNDKQTERHTRLRQRLTIGSCEGLGEMTNVLLCGLRSILILIALAFWPLSAQARAHYDIVASCQYYRQGIGQHSGFKSDWLWSTPHRLRHRPLSSPNVRKLR